MSVLTRCQESVNPHAYTLETITIITTVYQLKCHVLAITLAVFRLYLITWAQAHGLAPQNLGVGRQPKQQCVVLMRHPQLGKIKRIKIHIIRSESVKRFGLLCSVEYPSVMILPEAREPIRKARWLGMVPYHLLFAADATFSCYARTGYLEAVARGIRPVR